MRGYAVTVIEQAPDLTEIGAGLQVAPNGGRVLAALGVAPRAVDNAAIHLIDGPTGRSVIRAPLGPGFRFVHRADLVAALAARVAATGVRVRLNTKVAEVRADGREIRLADGEILEVSRLVGADGVRGAARAFVAPDHRPAFTGQVAWRAVVPVADWPQEARIHAGPGRHLVCYPLRGGTALNLVAVEERDAWVADSWSRTDAPENLQRAFAGFAAPVPNLLAHVERVHLWGLMDHGATPRWHRGACTLIGDAAHPTLPFLAQGANLALEDAWTLAGALDDPAGWERSRRPRVVRALEAARGNARNYHLTGLQQRAAHLALRGLGRVRPATLAGAYRWLYDHDVTRA